MDFKYIYKVTNNDNILVAADKSAVYSQIVKTDTKLDLIEVSKEEANKIQKILEKEIENTYNKG